MINVLYLFDHEDLYIWIDDGAPLGKYRGDYMTPGRPNVAIMATTLYGVQHSR